MFPVYHNYKRNISKSARTSKEANYDFCFINFQGGEGGSKIFFDLR